MHLEATNKNVRGGAKFSPPWAKQTTVKIICKKQKNFPVLVNFPFD